MNESQERWAHPEPTLVDPSSGHVDAGVLRPEIIGRRGCCTQGLSVRGQRYSEQKLESKLDSTRPAGLIQGEGAEAATFAWLGNFRRLVVRHDRSITIYQAFFHIACFMIVLRRVLGDHLKTGHT